MACSSEDSTRGNVPSSPPSNTFVALGRFDALVHAAGLHEDCAWLPKTCAVHPTALINCNSFRRRTVLDLDSV